MAKKRSLASIYKAQKKQADIEMAYELQAIGLELRNQHQEVVKAWNHKPTFRVETLRHPAFQQVRIIPKGRYANIWYYVDLGTKPHVIRAKNAPFLKFQTGYSARTAPVAKFNQGTGQKFGSWRQKKEVNHPGTKARKFSATLLDKLVPPFHERIQAAIARGFKRVK